MSWLTYYLPGWKCKDSPLDCLTYDLPGWKCQDSPESWPTYHLPIWRCLHSLESWPLTLCLTESVRTIYTASISQCSYQKHVKKYFLNRYSFFSTVQGNKWWKKKIHRHSIYYLQTLAWHISDVSSVRKSSLKCDRKSERFMQIVSFVVFRMFYTLLIKYYVIGHHTNIVKI